MVRFTVEVDDWLNLRIIAPIAALLGEVPTLSDRNKVIDAMIDAEDAIPDLLLRLMEFSWHYLEPGVGLDTGKWGVTADRLEELAQKIREGIAGDAD